MAEDNIFNYKDQVVLITGASGKLGFATVNAFLSTGAHLIACDHHSGALLSKIPELADLQKHTLVEGVDVSDEKQMAAVVADAESRFGRIDILVNTVGGYQGGLPIHQTSLETWDYLFNINTRSVFVTSSAVLPVMLKNGKGKIINISSHSAITGGAEDGAYSAAKSAVSRLTESMSAAYKGQGIQVNAILPSTLRSLAELAEDPKGGVTPEAVARLILFLCSDVCDIVSGALIPAYGLRF